MEIDLLNLKKQLSTVHIMGEKSLQDISYNKLIGIAKEKGFKDIRSKKAIEFMTGRAFVTKTTEAYVVYMASEILQHGFHTKIMAIYSKKTPNGTVYFSYLPESGYMCWTAHFFDRYDERVTGKGKREKAIRSFLKDFVMGGWLEDTNKFNRAERQRKGSVAVYFGTGAMLGNRDAENGITLWKTFVSKDMLRDDQKGAVQKEILKAVDELMAGTLSEQQEVFLHNYMKNLREDLKIEQS